MAMKARGFTIIELLVIIVIIAILASLSVVAYQGITEAGATVINTQLT